MRYGMFFGLLIWIAILLILLLSGCGSSSKDRTNRSNDITEESQNFEISHSFESSIIDRVEALWESAQLCTGIFPSKTGRPKIQIDYVQDYRVDPPSNAIALTWASSHYSRIWEGDYLYWDGEITNHEFIHHLLYLDNQKDDNHESPLFDKCSYR